MVASERGLGELRQELEEILHDELVIAAAFDDLDQIVHSTARAIDQRVREVLRPDNETGDSPSKRGAAQATDSPPESAQHDPLLLPTM